MKEATLEQLQEMAVKLYDYLGQGDVSKAYVTSIKKEYGLDVAHRVNIMATDMVLEEIKQDLKERKSV